MEIIGVASLLRMMPKGYEDACYATKAIVRNRDIKSPGDLMMLALFHLLTGCSLIEVSEISKLAKLGNISDVAFMKRFSNCSDWFKWIIASIQENNDKIINYTLPDRLKKHRIIAVDASDVVEKGRSSRIYRLHFGLDIVNMHALLYSITSNSIGEHLRNFNFSKGDLVLADRAYSNISGIEYCREKECEFIIRMRSNSFKLYDETGNPIDLLAFMQGKESGEIYGFTKKDIERKIGKQNIVRACFKKKSSDAINSTRKKMKQKESKKQMTFSPNDYSFNEYIVVLTSLGKDFTADEILELYRYRWQVELYFKRLKSILNYGELPKKSEKSIFAWLNGKLMIALLIESMVGNADFSPYDDDDEKYLEGNENDEITVINKYN